MTTTPLCRPGVSLPPLEDDAPRLLARADCEALFHQTVGFATGGGDTSVTIRSTWTTDIRWARNRPRTMSETREQTAEITRQRNGIIVVRQVTQFDDASLQRAMVSAEQQLATGQPDPNLAEMLPAQQYLAPPVWNDVTAQLSAQDLSDVIRRNVDAVVAARVVTAGYVEASAATWAIFNTRGLSAYAAATGALYTETIRAPDGTGSGWAGRRHSEWTKIEPATLSATALQICLDSVHPVALEPGRYTAILGPEVIVQLLHDPFFNMDRAFADQQGDWFHQPGRKDEPGSSKIGQPILDSRLTISTDPMDPECGYMPFDPDGVPYQPVTWVEQGILKALPYDRAYAKKYLGTDSVLPNPLAFRVSGGDTSVEEMIAMTKRGILVWNCEFVDMGSVEKEVVSLVTRNGAFLIEHGRITHPIKNLWIEESPFDTFNKVVQLGRPVVTAGQHVRHLWALGSAATEGRDLPALALADRRVPIVAPAIKVEDCNFTRLTDAV